MMCQEKDGAERKSWTGNGDLSGNVKPLVESQKSEMSVSLHNRNIRHWWRVSAPQLKVVP